jgi:uncharacterized protein with PQ loop repeat
MSQQEKQFTEKESLELITMMINKAKEAYYDTGISAIMWGVLIAFCSLERLAELQFHYSLPFDIYILTFIGVIPQILIVRKEKKERKVKSYDEVFMDYVWLGFAISIFLMIFITSNVSAGIEPLIRQYNELGRGRADLSTFRFYDFTAPFFLLLYGLPTFITGTACKFKPMLWGGVFCWVCCIVTIYTPVKVDLLLIAASAIMAWLIPGIIIEKEYRIYKKEQAKADV